MKLFVVSLATAIALWHFWPQPVKAWEVVRTGFGLQVSWNVKRAAALEVREGSSRRVIPLQGRSGTLLVPTENPDISVGARVLTKLPQSSEVEVFIKVKEDGKVSGTSTRYTEDEVRRELTLLASDAAMRWEFEPIVFEGRRVALTGS